MGSVLLVMTLAMASAAGVEASRLAMFHLLGETISNPSMGSLITMSRIRRLLYCSSSLAEAVAKRTQAGDGSSRASIARTRAPERKQQLKQSRKSVLLRELKACRDLKRGNKLHEEVIQTGNESCIFVATALLNMYAKCRNMAEARRVFDSIKQPDVACWNALMLGYAENGKGETSLELFARMKARGYVPDRITIVSALKACTSLAQKQDRNGKAEGRIHGKEIHVEIGCHLDIMVQNTLIDMYAKCGSMEEAKGVFDSIKQPDVVSWNALMLGYAENGEGTTALDLFQKMKSRGYAPDSITFVAALKACTSLALGEDGSGSAECLERGKRIHLEIGSHSDVYVQSSLIDMYSKCGNMVEARQVFDSLKHPSVVSWNALLLGYAENGKGGTALELFERLKAQGCATPNSVTFIAALKAVSSLALEQDPNGRAECRERGRRIHSEIAFHHPDLFLQSTLVDMYAKCGSMVDARKVFDGVINPDVVSWNALISGYAANGDGVTALELFVRMRVQGCAPNSVTFVAALKACSLLGALESGRKIHGEVNSRREVNGIVVTSLVDFYAKCGSMVEARKVFDSHTKLRNLITWNAMLGGYSRLGDNNAVFNLFQRMQDSGIQPNGVTFLCILTCCSHAGLLEKARDFFEAMSRKYGLTPAIEHYTCMVDILARSNKLSDAMAMLKTMPCMPNTVTWMSMLAACRKWKNVEIGRLAFKSLVSLNEENAPAYVLMAHIYRSRGMLEEQEIVLVMRKKCRAWKDPGQSSWTDCLGEVHTFLVGDNISNLT